MFQLLRGLQDLPRLEAGSPFFPWHLMLASYVGVLLLSTDPPLGGLQRMFLRWQSLKNVLQYTHLLRADHHKIG